MEVRGATKDDYIIRLSSHLHALTKCALSSEKVFSLAEDILEIIKEKDAEYYDHITEVVKDGMQPMDVHNFAYEILMKDKKKSVKIWNDLDKKKRRNWKETELQLFADVNIYLRKWMSEAFVGIYSNPTILYVWDYLFMHDWKAAYFKKLCLVTLALI